MEQPQNFSNSIEAYRHLVQLTAINRLEQQQNKSGATPAAEATPRDLAELRQQAIAYCDSAKLNFNRCFPDDVTAEVARLTATLRAKKSFPVAKPAKEAPTRSTQLTAPVYTPNHRPAPTAWYESTRYARYEPVSKKSSFKNWFWAIYAIASILLVCYFADDLEPQGALLLLGALFVIPAIGRFVWWLEHRKARPRVQRYNSW
ncbi:MAG TPA: hypothetical protein V6C81_11560 [Planktothrix sp.]